MQIAQGAPLCRAAASALGMAPVHGCTPGRDRDIDRDLAFELPLGIEDLDAPVAAVRHVDVALGVGRDAVRRIELAELAAALAPLLRPAAVFIVLGHARIGVPVADEDVALRAPGDVGRLAELAVQRRARRVGARPGNGLVRRLLLAAGHHRHAALGVEANDHVRPLVDGPDVVVLVDAHRVGIRPGVRFLPISRRYLPSGPNSSNCAAAARWAGPVVPPRENTKMCPFERTATSDTSPKCRSAGSLKKLGVESKGISGTACCAHSGRPAQGTIRWKTVAYHGCPLFAPRMRSRVLAPAGFRP